VKVTASDELALAALRRNEELARMVADANIEARRSCTFADVKEGELAAVTRNGDVYRLNPYKLDLAGLEGSLSRYGVTSLPSVTEARASFEIDRQQLDQFWTQRRTEAAAERVTVFEERAADAEVRSVVAQAERGAMVPFAEGAKVIEKGLALAEKVFDGIANAAGAMINALGDLLSTPSKPTELQAEVAPKVRAEKQQEAADSADYAERAERLDALLSQIARQDAERRLRRELGTELDDDRGREREL
jgi:hypothetical protein